MLDFHKLKKLVESNNKFLLTTHVNPDADAIGSELAFYNILKKLKKEVRIINYSETPYYLQFLDDEKIIEKFNKEIHKNIFNETDVIVCLDLNQANRIVKMEPFLRQSTKLKICIDHHQNAENFVDHQFIDTQAAATAHIIYDFIVSTSIVELDEKIALQIYAGLMTDTGSFRFERTTPDIHRIAAHLLEYSINPFYVYDVIYNSGKFGKIKLLGEAINSLQRFGENKELVVMTLMRNSFDTNEVDESDTDGFVNLCMSIEGVKIGLKFLELTDGFKVSLRSKGEIPVHNLAAEFGGGGHKNAAGIRIRNGSLTANKEKIISRTLEFINELEKKNNV